jgi:hypothetical protein
VQGHRQKKGWHKCRTTGGERDGTSAGPRVGEGVAQLQGSGRGRGLMAQVQGHRQRKGWHKCRTMGKERDGTSAGPQAGEGVA